MMSLGWSFCAKTRVVPGAAMVSAMALASAAACGTSEPRPGVFPVRLLLGSVYRRRLR